MYIAQNKKTYANISNDGGSVAINPVTTYLTTVSLKKTVTPLAALTAPSAHLQSNSIAPSPIVSSGPTPLPVSAVALPLRTQQQGQGLVLTKDTKRFTQPKGVYVSAQTAGCTRSLDSNRDNKENHRLSNLNDNAATNNSLTASSSSSSVLDSDSMILLKSIAVVKSTTDLLKTMKMSGSKGHENKDEDACSIYSPVMSGNNINGPTSPPLMDTSTTPTVEVSSPEAASASGNNMFMFDNRKRKHNMSRRGTLSPGTARAMMLEAFAMDTRREDNSNSSRSAFSSPLKLISNTSFDCSSISSSSPLKQLINTIAGSMDIVVCDDEDDSATIPVSNDSLDNSSQNSRGTAEDSITIPQRLDSIIIECKSSSSNRKDDDASSSRAESPLQKFQRSESPDPSIEQSHPTTGDRFDINGDDDRDDDDRDDDDRDDAVHEMDLEETAIDGGTSVGIEGLGMVMVTEGEEEITSMEAYGKELDSLLCDVSSSDVEQLWIDPSLSTNMSIDTYSPITPSVSSIINDDSLYISMDDCRDDDMSIIIIPTADPIDCDVSNRSSSILTHASNNNNNNNSIIIRPLPAIKLQYASPIPAQKRPSPLPSRYFLVETMDGAGVRDPESVFHIKCPSPMNQSLTASSVSSFSLSSPSLKPPSPPNAPPSIKPSPLQKRAYNVSPIVCALSPLFNQSLSSIVTADESTDSGVRDDDVIMQDTVNGSSDDDVERIHHIDTTEVINKSSDACRAAAPFTPTSIVVKDDGLREINNSREINKSSSSNSSSKPSTIIHDSSMDDSSPYSLVQYYRKQLCPSSSSSSDEQLLLGSDCSSFELLESMLEQEYLQCQGRDMRDDDSDSDGDSCENHSVERHTTTTSPPVNCDSIHTDRASFSVDSDLLLSQQSAQQTTVGSHVDDDGIDDVCDSLAPLDLVQIEVQAERRLKLRLEAAHWQYKWEMVMARLINTVIEKQRLKIADL